MMKKNVCLVLLLALAGFSLSAQEAPRAVLSDTWMENFFNNWEAINSGMSDLNEESDDMTAALMRFAAALAGCLEDTPPDFTEYRASFLALRNTRLPPESEKIFTRYSMEPDVFWVCMMGFMLLSLERDYGPRGNMAELRRIIHPDDFTVLEKNFDRLRVIFGNF